MTLEIALSRGLTAVIDDVDGDLVHPFTWYAVPDRSGLIYAARSVRLPAGRTWQRMHQLITGYTMTDHRNGDGLDNRRANLRPANKSLNAANRGPQRNNTSGYKGVTFHRRNRRWVASIDINRRRRHLGYFDTAEKAARAYDAAAVAAWGEYARPNLTQPIPAAEVA